MKAIWNGQVIAESNETVVIEGNHYFPESSVKKEFLVPSTTETVCHWKGKANYYSLNIGGKENKDAVWFYSNPSELARSIKDKVALWKGVEIVK